MAKKKERKISAKKEKYKKFKKDKPSNMTFTTPDPSPEDMVEIKDNEKKLEFFFKRRHKIPPRVINKRKLVSKRDKVR